MKGLVEEFKTFAMRGNVLDLAVGIIMGAAFGSIVNSLVNDVIMPPIGRILGGVDFSNLFINISGQEVTSLAQAKEIGAATINFGVFLNAVINFIVVALAVFLLVKAVNRMTQEKKAEEAAAPPPPDPAIETQKQLVATMEKLIATMEKK